MGFSGLKAGCVGGLEVLKGEGLRGFGGFRGFLRPPPPWPMKT